ncbi:MAG: hypothetical protein QOF86_2477 [Baekduia sp.]|nr:hypothetical protein [Baekduia sp.]
MAVYVDDAFAWLTVPPFWKGGGHLQADTTAELHAFAEALGLRRTWFQHKAGRPWHDHYDLTAAKREQAIAAGAIAETTEQGRARRKALRRALDEQGR